MSWIFHSRCFEKAVGSPPNCSKALEWKSSSVPCNLIFRAFAVFLPMHREIHPRRCIWFASTTRHGKRRKRASEPGLKPNSTSFLEGAKSQKTPSRPLRRLKSAKRKRRTTLKRIEVKLAGHGTQTRPHLAHPCQPHCKLETKCTRERP